MMDLAEIRKKARSKKDRTIQEETGTAQKVSRSASSIQGTPGESVTMPKAVPQVIGETVGGDPLEALFRFRPEIELATEESYLQGLLEREQEKGHDLRQWLTFSLGSEEYALDIGNIREIIKPREITDLPRVPGFILGIISLRGVIIPVFDLKKRLKLGEVEISPASRIIVCQHEDRSVGLVVDNLNQVVSLPGQGIEPPPAVLSGLDRDMVGGVGRYQGRMLILLNLSNVLDAELI